MYNKKIYFMNNYDREKINILSTSLMSLAYTIDELSEEEKKIIILRAQENDPERKVIKLFNALNDYISE